MTIVLATICVVLEKVSNKRHYATFGFGRRVPHLNIANRGDEIQGYASLQFLPFIYSFVERDDTLRPRGVNNITVFFNGWWGDPHTEWPPPANLNPIFVALYPKYKIFSRTTRNTSTVGIQLDVVI